ncbi:MIP/aquaporin family protein [Deinococcus cellulosilyticus]|uniref:Aquaporin n=1 Tax=Deinococcus cellulosilyticus (strain DSM 18568 / NBRC 106333 / KACC 11606 / 5516J-15) TaxID=1223518 RepID=A0A511MVW3_DEIC1|nr:MIP/aquaporin family protein [Deinococcus cellulosilyticus]GEM44712.1 aquaporin [Deinococcus cellulosilyticus NBRC 106333 = KACC 11606]
MKYTTGQEFISELIGTLVLIAFGLGVVAMVVLFPATPAIPGEVVKGGYTNIVLGWGLAVTMGVFISAQISGAHLNPAVTLALAVTGRFSWSKVLPYLAAQMMGAFLGAAIVFAVYYGQWIKVDPTFSQTAGVFSTFPAVPGFWPGFVDQVVGTALLMGMILAIGDHLKTPSAKALAPVVFGLLVVAIGASFGGMHGFAVNPARDLAPRLFSLVAGFENNGLVGSTIWIIPVVGPIAGALVGAWLYDLTIGRALKNESAPSVPAAAVQEAG